MPNRPDSARKPGRTAARPAPEAGLYDPWFEHDACGVGFVVDIKGRKSNQILKQAIQILKNLDHRGAAGSEANTGDGAGVLIQMPHAFLKEACKKARIALPEPGEYGVRARLPAARPDQAPPPRGALRADRPGRGPDGPRLADRAGRQRVPRRDRQVLRAVDPPGLRRAQPRD